MYACIFLSEVLAPVPVCNKPEGGSKSGSPCPRRLVGVSTLFANFVRAGMFWKYPGWNESPWKKLNPRVTSFLAYAPYGRCHIQTRKCIRQVWRDSIYLGAVAAVHPHHLFRHHLCGHQFHPWWHPCRDPWKGSWYERARRKAQESLLAKGVSLYWWI